MATRLLSNLTILVVDDHDDAREVLALILRAQGATVDVAGGAIEALQRFAERRPDVLVSDIAMPERDGFWLIRELNTAEHGPPVPAVAVTARVDARDRRMILAAGFQAHIPKPVDIDALLKAILDVTGAARERASR